jgi:putrescine transport system ATP-binding protein
MMFQSYALFPHMNVEQNIAYGLKRDHMPKGEIADRVAELLILVKLQDYGKRKPHQLSGGQRQRVALARALAKRPKLLLLDEPLGALDKKLREETQFELVKIQESLGVTFIVVTHDQEEAMTLATRIGVMNQGEIAMVGEPTDIYEFPNSRFVANFIGSANMVEGIVTEDEPDHVRIRSAELGCDIYVGHGVDCAPDQILWWAIRPEKMVVSRDRPDTPFGANVTTGVVEDIAYLGDMSVYQIVLDGGKRIRVSQTNTVRGNPDAITWDEKVFVSWGDNAGSVLTV